jgi:virginiamycin B lyase
MRNKNPSNGFAASMNKMWVAAFLLVWPALAAGQDVAIPTYAVPTPNAFLAAIAPQSIAAGPDGALWFTEFSAANIGRITISGSITEYPLPAGSYAPNGITAGPDGAMWFALGQSNQIGRVTIEGDFTVYPVPTPSSAPLGITAGPDGALWFTENMGSNIGRITTAGVVTEYALPAGSFPNGITHGPDGALWFAFSGFDDVGMIGRITTAGVITAYATPTVNSDPEGITTGPDGALWFTELSGNNIGRITTTGAITEYAIPTARAEPDGIATGPDGALWFAEEAYIGAPFSQIGRITTGGAITEHPLPVAESQPFAIAQGPDKALWSTVAQVNVIAQVVFPTATLSLNPSMGSYQTSLTFTGSGFAANEEVLVYLSGVGSTVLARGTADATGSFTATARQPQLPYGPREFLCKGQSSGKLGAASYLAEARLTLNPTSGPAGSSVTATGYGFSPNGSVDFGFEPHYLLGFATAGLNGTVTLTFTVPSFPSGTYNVNAQGETNDDASARFTIE